MRWKNLFRTIYTSFKGIVHPENDNALSPVYKGMLGFGFRRDTPGQNGCCSGAGFRYSDG